jgi:uncharacterized Zn-finger protein
MDDESCEALQVMAMTASPSVKASSLSNATSTSVDEASPRTPTEYTSSPTNSDHSLESPHGLDIAQAPSVSSDDAASPVNTTPPEKAKAPSDIQCEVCQTTYDTQGQLKYVKPFSFTPVALTDSTTSMHLNRKHRRRYRCTHCSSAFSLKADLKRHERSVHKDIHADQVFICPNPLCSIPEKKFTRRDNFERHARRCRNRELG